MELAHQLYKTRIFWRWSATIAMRQKAHWSLRIFVISRKFHRRYLTNYGDSQYLQYYIWRFGTPYGVLRILQLLSSLPECCPLLRLCLVLILQIGPCEVSSTSRSCFINLILQIGASGYLNLCYRLSSSNWYNDPELIATRLLKPP